METSYHSFLHMGRMRCLHDRARGIISTQDDLQKEIDHLARVLKQRLEMRLKEHWDAIQMTPAEECFPKMEDWKSLVAGPL